MSDEVPDRDSYTVGWICALSTESTAARVFLDEAYQRPDDLTTNDSNDYVLGRIGGHNVVIVVLPEGEYGIASAAAVAMGMLRSFPSIRLGLMVGVGGGAPSTKHDIRLGDVVVSSPREGKSGVFQYDFGKTVQDQAFHTTGALNLPPITLRTAVNGLKSDYEIEGHQLEENIAKVLEKKPRLRSKYARPAAESDRLYKSVVKHLDGSDEDCETLCGLDPIHFGTIASANQVMKDALLRDKLAKEKGVLCFEMEAAGLMNQFPCLVVRGICDYSDTHKNKAWQGYAAMVAAAYAKDVLCRIVSSQVLAEEKLGNLLAAVESIKETANEQKNIAKEHLDLAKDADKQKLLQQQKECLHLFRLTRSDKDAAYESYKERVEERVEGTCQWVLEHDAFSQWQNKDTGPILISADPGCGKSVLAKYMIDKVLPAANSTVCYFFFKENDQNSIRQALCALLHQLLCNNESLIEHAIKRFEKDGKGLIDSVPSLWSVLEDVVLDPRAGSIILVIDALDECAGSDLEDLLRNVKRQIRKSQGCRGRLKYLITSRPYDQILSTMRDLIDDYSNIRIPGEDESHTISQEVNLVIKYRVERLAKERDLSDDIKSQLAEQLLNIPHRTYLWVYLVFEFLRKGLFKKTKLGVTVATQTLPKTINDAYDRILSKSEVGSEEDSTVRRTLAIILAAQRPLTLAEMNVAVNVGDQTHSISDIDLEPEKDFLISLRSWCGLFVSVYEGKVYLLHQTAREFLLADPSINPSGSTNLRWHRSINIRKAQTELAQICMRYLNLFRSCPTLLKESQILALFDYAERYWINHFRNAEITHGDVVSNGLALEIFDSGSDFRATWSSCHLHTFREEIGKISSVLGMAAYLGLQGLVESLVQNVVDVDFKDSLDPGTPLLWATWKRHAAIAELLLHHGADINADGRDYPSALIMAMGMEKETVVQLFLESGANVNATHDAEFGTALQVASYLGDQDLVRLLICRGAEINTETGKYGNPLQAAVVNGGEALFDQLLELGADVNLQGGKYGSPLQAACAKQEKAIFQKLLDNNANVNAQGGKFGSALQAACAKDKEEMVKELLDKGADVNAQGGKFGSALQAACAESNESIIKILLEHGADPNTQNDEHVSALILACLNLTPYPGQETIRMLLEHGALVVTSGHKHSVALEAALYRENDDIIDQLVYQNARVNVDGAIIDGLHALLPLLCPDEPPEEPERPEEIARRLIDVPSSAFARAAKRGEHVVGKILLELGAEPLHGDRKETALFLASTNGHLKVAQMLLDMEIGPSMLNSPDHHGVTPLGAASFNGHVDVVQLLLQHSADPTGLESLNLALTTPLPAIKRHNADRPGPLPVPLSTSDRDSSDDPDSEDLASSIILPAPNQDDSDSLYCEGMGSITPYLEELSRLDREDLALLSSTANQEGSGLHSKRPRDILHKCADWSVGDKNGQTPLSKAAKKGHFEVVQLLLKAGADMTPDLYGRTPLHFAATHGHLEVVRLLLQEDFAADGFAEENATVNNTDTRDAALEDSSSLATTPSNETVPLVEMQKAQHIVCLDFTWIFSPSNSSREWPS
ncbi:hypothetical protein OPT61_g6283 [Boeremia exigua]|uniref:Uncharacterized protein n=1 Tax=Boeremia exigua TaxID=749465 RepID=A0ACC2I7A3_9PLEO|nr:hypothetical protein OPT61_g6283 [Boeremia exigua]